MIDARRPWTVFSGDCRSVLADLDENSVDACVTDSPYGLSTILDPPNLDREALWLKLTSGQKESAFCTLVRSWLDTGENPKVRGRGFMGEEWDALVPPPNTWRAIWRVLKPGAYCFSFGGTRTASLIEWSMRFADYEIEDWTAWLYGHGFPKRVRLDLKIDEHLSVSKSPPSLRFVGWDRASRPGFEPIIVACKPLRGTIAENAMRYGTGGMNVDGCRIPRNVSPRQHAYRTRGFSGFGAGHRTDYDARGGFPSNVILNEHASVALDEQAGLRKHGALNGKTRTSKVGRLFTAKRVRGLREGGASQFFYTAKASTSERDKGLEDLPPLTPGERSGGREEGSAGINAYAGTRSGGGRNPHKTVKPISLMRYLVRRASPPGAWAEDPANRPLVLDPFAGSGSTGVACMVEGLRFVGIELDPAMADVARRRLQHAYALPREDGPSAAEDGDAEAPPPPRGQTRLF